jgi:hypothetical protein
MVIFVFYSIYIFQLKSDTNSKIAERSEIDAPKTQIHDGALSCPGACTSIKSGGVKLIVWAQTSLLVK